MQGSLDHAQATLQEKQSHIELLTALLQQTTHRVSSTVERFRQLKSTAEVCLSRLANYEQRVAVMGRRVSTLGGEGGVMSTLYMFRHSCFALPCLVDYMSSHVHVHVLYMYMYCTCTCTVHVTKLHVHVHCRFTCLAGYM